MFGTICADTGNNDATGAVSLVGGVAEALLLVTRYLARKCIMIRTSRRQHIRCRRQHLTPLAHKLQAGVPKEEVEEERMGSQIQWRLPVFADTTTVAVAHTF